MSEYAKQRILNYFFYITLFLAIGILFLIIPFIIGIIYHENIYILLKAYIIPGIIIFFINFFTHKKIKAHYVPLKDAMFISVLSWLSVGILGAIPLIVITKVDFLNALFETVSGFTTTGITIYHNVESLPHSILIWRSITQWIGGIGILSMFIIIGFKGGIGIHKFFFSETHKIAIAKPYPGIFFTIRIIWYIYISLTIIMIILLLLLKVNIFSAINHSLTTVSTGGFSIYNDSIKHFSSINYQYAFFIKMVFIIFMLIGSLNFFVIYNIISIRRIKALWKNFELRYFWLFIVIAITIIAFSMIKTNFNINVFKKSVFHIISLFTSTGYTIDNLNSRIFSQTTRFVFLIAMFIGGNSGSTSSGFKTIRIAILLRLISMRIFRLNTSRLTVNTLTIDKHILDNEEINRLFVILFLYLLFITTTTVITLLFSNLNIMESLSGAMSVISNMGPSFIDNNSIVNLSPIVKLTYIFVMIAGRLEIFPIIIVFNKYFFK